MSGAYDGEMYRRGQPGYEEARRAAVWSARTPDRFPDVIVQATTEADVVQAVRDAGDAGLRVAVRSGGHSWSGNHIRDGGMLVDVSRLTAVEINPDAMTASVQPGCYGDELIRLLDEHDLFFPAGHCAGIGLGGYLLQGGFGYNSRIHGPACMSVLAIDAVTADGSPVHASREQNADLLWAARGSGPGFFAAVTRFHLRLYRRPQVIATGLYLYPIDALDEVFRWAHAIGPQVPRALEFTVLLHRSDDGNPEIIVTAPVMAETEDEARTALSLLETCPVLHRATLATPYAAANMADLYASAVNTHYPDGYRYVADNMWTHAGIEDLLPGLRRIAETLPEPPSRSHMFWQNWGPGTTPAPVRPDMAYSLEDDTYIALYGVWQEPKRDDACVGWVTDRMQEMEHLSTGIQLADENLEHRPARFVSDQHLARLDELRTRYDPAGTFYSWLGRPS